MAILTYFRRQDYTNKKYPEGIVTPENIAKEGEELGERISMLDCDDPDFPLKKTFGQRMRPAGCPRILRDRQMCLCSRRPAPSRRA